jgi:predicted GNAT family acetyltransferase
MYESRTLQTSEVVHNAARQRFELYVGEALCVLDYQRKGGKMVIYHTEVPQPFEGRGLAARMTRAALDFARSENLQVEPRCPYTARFMQKHREYADLLIAR